MYTAPIPAPVTQLGLNESREIRNNVFRRVFVATLFKIVKTWKLQKLEARGILLYGPSFPLFPSIAFSNRFKWSFPFCESLSQSHIVCVWNHLQTFHKVRVWGKISMLSKLFTKLQHFLIFSIWRDKMIPFWKGWCSQQTGELLRITKIISYTLGSLVWLQGGFRLTGFEDQTLSTNS